nr:F-box/FBD/LRR-repeat protein At1g13570-like [Ipomoea batatas]
MLNWNKKARVVVLDPMASYRRSRTPSAARKDMISQLPDDVKEKILECLPTSDAARTALLSTDWKDVWLRHGRLVFDTHFFKCLRKCEGDKRVALVSIINDILLHRAGPVKKFTLHIFYPEDPKPEQSDLDRWCRYLSRNGIEELNICISGKKYRLPSCIVSCRTIRQLKLGGDRFDDSFDFDCPVNAGCIFHSVTSLVFRNVQVPLHCTFHKFQFIFVPIPSGSFIKLDISAYFQPTSTNISMNELKFFSCPPCFSYRKWQSGLLPQLTYLTRCRNSSCE